VPIVLQKESFSFQLKGCSTDHIMYIRGGESLTADVQSLSVLPQPESDDSQSILCSIIVTELPLFASPQHMLHMECGLLLQTS